MESTEGLNYDVPSGCVRWKIFDEMCLPRDQGNGNENASRGTRMNILFLISQVFPFFFLLYMEELLLAASFRRL